MFRMTSMLDQAPDRFDFLRDKFGGYFHLCWDSKPRPFTSMLCDSCGPRSSLILPRQV